MKEDQHLVFGAGLIGGYLAGCIIHRGGNTNLIARNKVRAKMLEGFTITDYLNHTKIITTPHFVDSKNADKTNYDYIWLTVKCTAITMIIKDLTPFISTNTIIICCQNGLGSDHLIKQAFPENIVLKSLISFNVINPKTSRWHRSTEGGLIIEANNSSDDAIKKFQSEFLPVLVSKNIVAEQWAKLQLNLTNPVNALSALPLKAMLENSDYRKIIAILMEELLQVTNEIGLTLPKLTALPAAWTPKMMRLPSSLFTIVASKMLAIDKSARLSMWWDLSAGRKTEIDFLNAAVVRAGDKLGIDCKANRRLVSLIHEIEMGETKAGLSAHDLASRLLASYNNS